MSGQPEPEAPAGAARCRRCNRLVGRHGVQTRAGVFCKHCAVTLPSHLHRPAKPRPKATR